MKSSDSCAYTYTYSDSIYIFGNLAAIGQLSATILINQYKGKAYTVLFYFSSLISCFATYSSINWQNAKYYNFMNKSYIYLLLLLVFAAAQQAQFGTEAYFLSPHAISRQREVHDALQKVAPRISVARTTYNHLGATYTADNFTLQIAYNDGRQTIDITGADEVLVSGGKIEFEYLFNYSKTDSSKTITGYATGSVISDPFNYTKMLTYGQDGHLIWALVGGSKALSNLTISSSMKIKRMEPFDSGDMSALQDILDRAISSIIPGTVESQLIQKFNSIMPMTLNATLNSYILGPEIDYSFSHPSKGQLNMSIVHHVHKFDVKPVDGYKIIFLTEIKDWPQPVCENITVPYQHLSFDFYGGTQNIHLNCLYQEVVEFMQAKGWLDTRLDTSWDCSAFQFYAGDLYDMINNLYTNVSPRELLDGECKASPNGLKIRHGRDTDRRVLELDVTYACTAKTRDKSYKYVDVLNFTADVKFLIQPKADKIVLDFSIFGAEVINMSFKGAGPYYVGDLNLAMFKANQVLKKLTGMKTFGSGFPSLPHEMPATEITQNFTVYFDVSHKATPGLMTLQL